MNIRSAEFIKYEGGKNVVRYEFDIDAASELTGLIDAIDPDTIIAQGSIAWAIGSGEFYGMTAAGEWVNQTTSGGDDNE